MRSFLARTAGFLLAVCLVLAALSGSIRVLGTSPGVMFAMISHDAPPETTGLNREDYAPVTSLLSRYLSILPWTWRDVWERDGLAELYQQYAGLFHDYEWEHLFDCGDLFRLDWLVLTVSGGLALLSAALSVWLRKVRGFLVGIRAGLLALLSLMLVLIVYALADFDGLFILFHRTFFRNDLWLLNPQTDLLVRMMPLPYFIHCALIIAGCTALAMLLLFLKERILSRRIGRQTHNPQTGHEQHDLH